MKRRFMGVIAAVLILLMGSTNVYAALSPAAEAAQRQLAETYAANVISVTAESSSGAIPLVKETASIEDVAAATAVAQSKGNYIKIFSVVELKVASAVSLATISKGVNVQLTVNGLTPGYNVYVFHELADGTWETLKPTVGYNYLEVKMYSFSPVAIVQYPAGVVITPSEHDTSAEDQENAQKEAQSLANNITNVSMTSTTGSLVTVTKTVASVDDVAMAKYVAATKGNNSQVLAVAELKTTASSAVLSKGIQLTLHVTGVKYGDNVYVFHQCADGTWEILKPSEVGTGYLTVKMYSLSPIAVVWYPKEVIIVPTVQDTSAEDQLIADKEAQDLAGKITFSSAISSTGTVVMMTKGNASAANVATAKGIAASLGSGAKILGMAEFTTTVDASLIEKGIQATLYVSDVKAGENVYILHGLSNGTWETIKPFVVGSGYVTFRLYSLSPIAIVWYENGVSIIPNQQVPSTGTDSTNPDGSTEGTGGNSQNNNQGQSNPQTNNQNQSNSQNQNNNQNQSNNQSNSQTNNQNNPVNVNQSVTVNYPDTGQYSNGYGAGFKDGFNAGKNTGGSSGSSSTVTSPKTGAELPALPFFAMFAAAGLAVCKKKNS